MIIAPLVVSTTVVGIAKMGDAKALGRIFLKHSFIYLRLIAVNCLRLDNGKFLHAAQELILLHTVPKPPEWSRQNPLR